MSKISVLLLLFVAAVPFCFCGLVQDPAVVAKNCGPNAAPAECGSVCEPSCAVPKPEICPAICELNGCRCLKNFLRDTKTNKCVRPCDCT